MTQLISIAPEPPTQGQDVTICYSMPTGANSVTVTVSYSPGGTQTSHILTREDNCVTVRVPDNAESLTVSDASGASPDKFSNVLLS